MAKTNDSRVKLHHIDDDEGCSSICRCHDHTACGAAAPAEDGCSCHASHEDSARCAYDANGHGEHEDGHCRCGEQHSFLQEDGAHSKGHDHCSAGGCSCGCGHEPIGGSCGCGHDHDSALEAPFSKSAAVIGAAVIIMSLLIQNKTYAALMMAAGVLAVGYPLFLKGIRELLRLHFDELGLLTIAVAASLGLAAASADPFEGVLEAMAVTVLFRIGNLLEARAVAKSRRDIESLVNIRPDTAVLILPDNIRRDVPAAEVLPGSLILLKAGDRVPLDCEVVSGTGYIDFSAITGEPLPVFAEEGSKLLSGAINTDGLLTCRTTAAFEDSTASRIIRLVRESSASKGRAESLISRFAAVYTPAVVTLAALLAVLPPLLGAGSFGQWLSRALVFLVASCPCALVISVPLTFFAGVGTASRAGVLIKGTRYLETLAAADCAVFDKTGTITQGHPSVREMLTAQNALPRERLLALAAAAERNSSHPAAKAITGFAGEQPELAVSGYSEISGMGTELVCGGDSVLCGSYRLMERHGIDYGALPRSDVYLAVNGVLQCGFILHDEPREDAAPAIERLREMGFEKIAVLTGDSAKAAEETAAPLGIDTVFAQLLPEHKPQRIRELKEQGHVTVFIGDGINDAPALAEADVGAAMGLGADAAIEAADIVLTFGRLGALPKAVSIARRTVKKANQNIAFALSVKAAVLLLGALGLASMWMAVFADVGVSILAVLNSLTLLKDKG